MYTKEDYFKAIKLQKDGLRIVDIARKLKIKKDTVTSWLNRGNKPKVFYCFSKKSKEIGRIMGKNNLKEYELPKISNEDFSYLIGVLLSDGNLQKRSFMLSVIDKEFAEIFKNKIQKLFNVRPSIKVVHFPNHKNHKDQYVCGFHSLMVRNYLYKLCYRNGIKRVPAQYFNLRNKPALYALVRGFFDGDGTVWSGYRNKKENWKQYNISAVFQHKVLCRDFQRILLLLNVKSGMYADKGYYKLTIYGQKNVKLYQKLFFEMKRKKFKRL